MPAESPKLLDQVRHALRVKHYALRTEEAYTQWLKRYILFHDTRHPSAMNTPEIEAFLTHLAVHDHVTASTQNQALAALLFLSRHVLHQELVRPVDAVRARTPQRLPTVLRRAEAQAVRAQLKEPYQVMAHLMYGVGLRLMECLRLRVKDVDFAQRQMMVRSGKGDQDRATLLPDRVGEPFQRQLRSARALHQNDLEQGYGRV